MAKARPSPHEQGFEMRAAQWSRDVLALSDMLLAQNRRFDTGVFVKACWQDVT
jgi:hypothetical protein